jgi:hypothetical protein
MASRSRASVEVVSGSVAAELTAAAEMRGDLIRKGDLGQAKSLFMLSRLS